MTKSLFFNLLGAAQLAIYTFATAIPIQFQALRGVVDILTIPKFSSRSFRSLRRGMLPKLIVSFIFSIVIIGSYWLFAPILYKFAFPQYQDSVVYTRYAGFIVLLIPASFLRQALLTHMKEKRIYANDLAEPILRICLYLVLIPKYKIWGAIFTLVSMAILQLVYFTGAFYLDKER